MMSYSDSFHLGFLCGMITAVAGWCAGWLIGRLTRDKKDDDD